MAMAVVLLIVSMFGAPAVYAADHVVGGSSGWEESYNYTAWTSGITFAVGDNLVFNYGSNHGVEQVTQSNYDSCTTGNPISSYSGGSTTIPLKNTGPMYFICPTIGHCAGGMKLAITVVAAGTTPTTPSSPSGSTPPPPPPPPPPHSGVAGSFSNISQLVLGISIILTSVFAFMG